MTDVAAGQHLDARLRPVPAALGLGRGDQPGAVKAGQFGRVPVGLALGEGLDGRRLAIVAEDAADGVEEDALAVGADAVAEEHRLFAGFAGQAVARDALQIGDQRLVAARDPVEERLPFRTVAARPDGGDHRHVVVGAVSAKRRRSSGRPRRPGC